MGKKSLLGIFIDPPIAVARLGDSATPVDAFVWTRTADPHLRAETIIAPTWSLDVQSDGTVQPRMPTAIVFRDEPTATDPPPRRGSIRPVAPFFELWALVGVAGSRESSWQKEALTPALLAAHGYQLADLALRAEAMNLKVARRTARPDLRYGTFPPVVVQGNDFTKTPLRATSPEGAKTPMIPPGRSIPLGAIQMLKSGANDPNALWAGVVDTSVLRFRVTPPAGEFYGPGSASEPIEATSGAKFPAVSADNAFLDSRAGWANAIDRTTMVVPSDTYDVYPTKRPLVEGTRSVGVVDDTSEVRLTVTLRAHGVHRHDLTATANCFVAPPDFAPDRRPFLSIADELNDRARPKPSVLPDRGAPPEDTDAWVADLFERIYEVVSLLNVDEWQRFRSAKLPAKQTRPKPIPGDEIMRKEAMSRFDKLRDPTIAINRPTPDVPLPITARARMRHRQISDIQSLVDFVLEHPGRLRALVRPPFHLDANEGQDATSMRMPPFMRNSNSLPLTIANWQYEILMAWADALEKNPRLVEEAEDGTKVRALSARSKQRQAQVTRGLGLATRTRATRST